MQDSARYIGTIPSLVDMVAGYNCKVSEVGRLALLALRHRNPRNADEILSCMRSRRFALSFSVQPWQTPPLPGPLKCPFPYKAVPGILLSIILLSTMQYC
jgi:hypothetical protein